ncbi:hypothetical protein SFRURICE_017995 [Spodoptera frugiperda]|nr:hypothetical protein SFRURICE_017995 [Spodoptera frugiperda]
MNSIFGNIRLPKIRANTVHLKYCFFLMITPLLSTCVRRCNQHLVASSLNGVQDNAGRSLCQTPPKALLRKNQQWMSGLKKTLMDRYKDDIRKEKKIYNDKKLKKGKEEPTQSTDAVPPFHPALKDSRNVKEFQYLNTIGEGAYGVVYRARDKSTDEIVALKRLKALNEKEVFSIAAQRELQTLLKIQHPNIVAGRELAVGSRRNHVYVVMEYVPHQLKSLIETMRQNHLMFSPEYIKCLMTQLLTATQHLHENHIIHRDLKTSNILLSQDGVLKVADFGLAREFESRSQQYTPGVCTRWYRAPELLLLSPQYSTPIDMWSIGCILGELINLWPLFSGTSELDQLNRIFMDLGTPSDSIWPGYSALPAVKNIIFDDYPPGGLRKKISCKDLSESGLSLLEGLLTYDPARRLTAAAALDHEYFKELPLAIEPARFPIAMESVDSGQYSATELEEDHGSHCIRDISNSSSHRPSQAANQKPHKDKSGLKKAATDRISKNKIRREKTNLKQKTLKRIKKQKQQIIDAESPFHPAFQSCRSVDEFQYLYRIDEGAFGVIHAAKDKQTGELVALKHLKKINEREGYSNAARRELEILHKMRRL